MYFRRKSLLFAIFLLAGCASQGLYRWVPFLPKHDPKSEARAARDNPYGPITGPVFYGLEMRLSVNPLPLSLTTARAFEAKIVLINRTKKSQNLRFPDGREYDFELRDAGGRKLVRWSDDQPVNPTPGYIIVNPGERSEFSGTISTRDMVAGRSYTLEGRIVGYDNMVVPITIDPVR